MVKAALFNFSKKTVRVGEIAAENPLPNEVSIQVETVGICGSDIHFYQHGTTGEQPLNQEFVLGHEYCGKILEIGKEVKRPDLCKGQLVAVEPTISCGCCEFCVKGRGNLCVGLKFTGTPPTFGAMRQQMVIPEHCVFPVPDNINKIEAPLLEPLTVALHACRLAGSLIGRSVAIVGTGTIGLMLQQLVMLYGGSVVATTDLYAYRRSRSKQYGALHVFDPNEVSSNTVQLVFSQGGLGADVVFEVAGTPESLSYALALARPGGMVVYIGICPVPMSIDFTSARRKELSLQWVRRTIGCYPAAIKLMSEKSLHLNELITHTTNFENLTEAFERQCKYADEVIKTMLIIP